MVSVAHVLTAADELGLLDQLASGPKDITELAHTYTTDPSMTALLLDALTGLDIARRDAVGRYTLTVDWLPLMRTLIRSWSQLSVVVRNGEPLVRADTAEGASDLYPDFLPVLSAMCRSAAHRAAQLLAGCGAAGQRSCSPAVAPTLRSEETRSPQESRAHEALLSQGKFVTAVHATAD